MPTEAIANLNDIFREGPSENQKAKPALGGGKEASLQVRRGF